MTAETAAGEAATEIAETVADNAGKILGFIVALGAAAAATWWVVKRVGIAAQNAADESGVFAPPVMRAPVAPELYDDPEPETEHVQEWGDNSPAGADYAR